MLKDRCKIDPAVVLFSVLDLDKLNQTSNVDNKIFESGGNIYPISPVILLKYINNFLNFLIVN